MGEQPFWVDRFGVTKLPNASKVHKYGLYLPNNPNISEEDIMFISSIVNKYK
jgi:CDP-6-deoxy-D-xylo-4-hexulose-3-dehydrase